jgi:ATP-dependent DNA helicase RecG
MWRIYPIYSELYGIKPWRFAEKIWNLLENIDNIFDEHLPQEFLEKYNLLWVKETIKNTHFPESYELQKAALQRIFFDRLLRVQLHSLIQKEEYEKNSLKRIDESDPRREIIKNFIGKLPFKLTNAQKKVIKNCIESIHDIKPMMALLQW